MRTPVGRVLVTGWPSFLHGEATAGDVLAMEAARAALSAAGIGCDLAWSPVLRPGGLTLDDAGPERYTHLVFCCGPLAGWQVRGLHHRYASCRRVAAGVSVIDPSDPAAAGFHAVLPRDGGGQPPARDLAAAVAVPTVPVAGIILASAQPEYGSRARHEGLAADLADWLAGQDCARLALDTRLDSGNWRHAATPAQLESAVRRLDVVLTTRLHGLVLALKNGIPALAIDPVAGGAKVAAQAAAWDWPAVLVPPAGAGPVLDRGALGQWWDWCLSGAGRRRARAAAISPAPSLSGLLTALRG
jgi:hypothetical protein